MSALTQSKQSDFIPASIAAIAPYFILALGVFAGYGNIFDNIFVFDDDLLIKLNVYLRDWHHIGDIIRGSTTSGAHIAGGFYRPIQILLYLLAFHIGGGSEFPFHLLNLSLHIANTCLVYRLGEKLGFNRVGAFCAALIWGLHPLHTEAVTYISGTADPLYVLFCLLALTHLLPNISSRKIIQIIPLFAFALLSKETAVMLPLLVCACLFYLRPERYNYKIYLPTWPLWLIAIAFALWRIEADFLDGPKTFAHMFIMPAFHNLKIYAEHPLYRLYTVLATLPAYAKLIMWPQGLHMERSFPVHERFFAAPVLTGCGMFFLAAAFILHKNRPGTSGSPLGWGLIWFFTAQAPNTGLLVQMNALFLEHWMYLPTVGLFLGLTETLSRLLQPRPHYLNYFAVITAGLIALCLADATYQQNKIWRDPPHFYGNIFAYGEQSARARNNLALYYGDHDDYAEAIAQFKQAIAISDSYAETRHNLALIYLRSPDQQTHIQDAIDNLNRAVEIDPQFYRSWQTLGDVYELLLHDPDRAAAYHQRAAKLKKLRE